MKLEHMKLEAANKVYCCDVCGKKGFNFRMDYESTYLIPSLSLRYYFSVIYLYYSCVNYLIIIIIKKVFVFVSKRKLLVYFYYYSNTLF